jgi:hypothetical protein
MRVLVMITFLISLPALACPQLAGTYATCRSLTGHTSGQSDMVVTQSVQNKVMVYEVNAIDNDSQEREYETYKADGKTISQVITDPESGLSLETSSRISCTSKALNIRMEIKFDGELEAYATVSVTKVGKQLLIDSESFDGEEQIIEKEICE